MAVKKQTTKPKRPPQGYKPKPGYGSSHPSKNLPYTYIPPPPVEPEEVYNSPVPNPRIINSTAPPPGTNATLKVGKIGDADPYIFGRCLAKGIILTADDSGAYVYIDIEWSRGEIDYIESIYVGTDDIGRLDGDGKVEHFNGTAGQAASTILTNLKGSYDSLPDIAHTVLHMTEDYGIDRQALIRGIKLYDPRTTSTAYSTNPALALAHIFVKSGYTMNWASVENAADYCDETVNGAKRWEIGGQILQQRSAQYWIHTLATYANCFYDIIGDEVYLVPDEPRSSNHTVTADDMIEGTVRLSTSGGNNVPDSVTVNGIAVTGERITYTYGTPGGAGTKTNLNLPFYQTVAIAGRKAEETYRKARNNKTLEFEGFDDGILRTVGDVGSITNAQYGLTNELMALIENRQLSNGRWRRKYYEYNATNYSDVLYTAESNYTTLFNPYNPITGPTPTAVEEVHIVNGLAVSRFKITFYGIEWAYLKEYVVTCYRTETGDVILNTDVAPNGTSLHTAYTTGPIVGGKEYTVEVRVRSIVNATGAPGTTTIVSSLATNTEADASGIDVTNMHIYILDGDAKYATTSERVGSPENGETWASRFGSTSPIDTWSDLLALNERFLENQFCDTVFQTEAWDSGQEWYGTWKYGVANQVLFGGTRSHFVGLSDAVSPLSFTDYSGVTKDATSQIMRGKTTVVSSPQTAGDGLHVRLPVTLSFNLGT